MVRQFALAALFMAGTSAAQAATVTYSSLAAFTAAVGPTTVAETFNGGTLNGTVVASVTGARNFANNRLQKVAGTATGNQSTTLNLSENVYGFAISVGSLGLGELANVYLDGVLSAQLVGTHSGKQFFGLTSTSLFNTITFSDATLPTKNTQFNIDNLRVAVLPVPAGFPLLLGGLGLLGVLRRRQRNA